MVQTPIDIIQKAEKSYISERPTISEYVQFSLKDNVDKIEAYSNSKHISGATDSLGRDKPFLNIVTAAARVWYRATDIDRANIRIKSTKSSDILTSKLANVKSQQWMREANFGVFLNEWGRVLSCYGSAVLKFVTVNGKLEASVVPWNRLILDSVEFEGNPVIEKHYYTPAQLRRNSSFNQEVVKGLLEVKQAREILDGTKKDIKADYIEVYELHGELPLSLLTDDENDDDTFVQQVHILSIQQNKDEKDESYCLYSGKEKDPYMITHLIKEDGRVMAIGAVEHLFEAQWMVNHNEKNIKDQLDLASKLIFQTSDPAYSGRNTNNLDTGSILYHEINQPLTQLANNSHDIASLSNSGQNWKNQAAEATSTPDAMRGNTMPSQTAARQVEALQQESHSLFELMTENKGLDIEKMWRMFVIPHIKTQLDTTDEIVATLDDYNIKEIDQLYIPNEAKRRMNERFKKEMFKLASSGINDNSPFLIQSDPQAAQAQIQDELKSLGNQRFFKPSDLDDKTWKEVFKDFEWEVEVEVTSEAHDKQATLLTLTTVLKEIASMGDIATAKTVLNKILEETGVFSPMELSSQSQTAAPTASISPNQLPSTTAQTPTTQTPVTQT